MPLTKVPFLHKLLLEGPCDHVLGPQEGRGSQICSLPSVQHLTDAQKGNGAHESARSALLLLRWCPTLLQTDQDSFSCVTVPDQITVSNLMALHISAPYNVYRFCHLAVGGQSHFPAFPMPSSLGGHFPIAVKCSPSPPRLQSLKSRVKVKIQVHGEKKFLDVLLEPPLLDISVSQNSSEKSKSSPNSTSISTSHSSHLAQERKSFPVYTWERVPSGNFVWGPEFNLATGLILFLGWLLSLNKGRILPLLSLS